MFKKKKRHLQKVVCDNLLYHIYTKKTQFQQCFHQQGCADVLKLNLSIGYHNIIRGSSVILRYCILILQRVELIFSDCLIVYDFYSSIVFHEQICKAKYSFSRTVYLFYETPERLILLVNLLVASWKWKYLS